MSKFTAMFFSLFLTLGVAVSANAVDFTGVYVGANVGGASGTSSAQTSTTYSSAGYFASSSVSEIGIAGNQALSTDGTTGGIDFGYNYQFGHWAIGAEVDYGALHLSESATTTANYGCCTGTDFTVSQSLKTRWLFTARPKAGFVLHNIYIYGTGGDARTHINYYQQFSDNFAAAGESSFIRQNVTGWVAGGGVEVRLLHHWSVKGEYLHVDFGNFANVSSNLTSTDIPPAAANPFTNSFDLHSNIARLGVNYRF